MIIFTMRNRIIFSFVCETLVPDVQEVSYEGLCDFEQNKDWDVWEGSNEDEMYIQEADDVDGTVYYRYAQMLKANQKFDPLVKNKHNLFLKDISM